MSGDDRAARVSRRGLLQATTAGAVLAGAGVAFAGNGPPPPTYAGGGRRVALSGDPVLHVLRRVTFGPTAELVAHVRKIGVDAFLDEQLAPSELPDAEVERILALFPTLRMSNTALRQAYADRRAVVVQELQAASLVRAVWSTHQLYEVMVEFWSNHFSIHVQHEDALLFKTGDDRDVIRAHALGRFADLLVASAQSPAMLAYLHNWLSSGTNPNEDYGRELLELHTLGVSGGYTERDVKQVALCLTGWDVDRTTWQFGYRPERHYVGPLRVMGWRAANGDAAKGVETGLSLLDYLAHHPSTARHIARRLCVRFVSDSPPASLVESAARVYLASDTQIVPVLRHIFASQAFRTSAGLKFRRPFELMTASLRAIGARYDVAAGSDVANDLIHLLKGLGHPPFGWQTPDGYPDTASAWLSTQALLNRWNMQQHIVVRGVRGLSGPRPDKLAATPGAGTTVGALVDEVCGRVAFQGVAGAHRAALIASTRRKERAPLTGAEAAALTPQLTALVLSSPYLQLR
ncbi:MAG TPA: DUF1800 domain-containing protein [Mycobacteriales bacterium]|nr:DUF1800 domain-containing protein [Mycobacteriales bacterium]